MKSKIFDYSVAPQSDSVAVIAAGPSTARYHNEILSYIERNNSLVLAANYNYGDIKSHYTYFTDHRKFFEQISNIDKKSKIIIREWSYRQDKNKIDKLLTDRTFYRVGVAKMPNGIDGSVYRSQKIKISPQGTYNYTTLGGAGFALLLIALLSRPKKIFFVGIDGPLNNDWKSSKKMTWDGKVVQSDAPSKNIKITTYFEKILFPNLSSRRVTVETFEGTTLYGIDKKKLGIKIL